MNRDLIAELADGPELPPDPMRDVLILMRASWLLAQHPEYCRASSIGKALRRVRIDLLAMAQRLDEQR